MKSDNPRTTSMSMNISKEKDICLVEDMRGLPFFGRPLGGFIYKSPA